MFPTSDAISICSFSGWQDGVAKSASVSGGAAAEEGDADEEGPKTFTPEVQLGAGSNLLFKETAKLFLKNPDKVCCNSAITPLYFPERFSHVLRQCRQAHAVDGLHG